MPMVSGILFLVAASDNTAPANPVQWASPSAVQSTGRRVWVWKRFGNSDLLPDTIYDDGQKIFLTWSKGRQMPAVFAVNKFGQEEMVSGFTRGNDFVIDDVVDHLVFRFEQARADARRLLVSRRR